MASLLSMVAVPSAFAADWSWQPQLEWRMDHQSNLRLSAQDPHATEAGWLSLSGALARTTPRTQWTLEPYVQIQRYNQESQLDAEDSSLRASASRQWEYSQLTLSADTARMSTLTSELAQTGIVDVSTRRDLRDAGAFWTVYLSSYSTMDAQLGYTDVKYPGGLHAGLVGYHYPNASLGYTRNLSPNTQWHLSAFGGRLTAPLTFTESRNVGLRTGVTRDLSAQTHLDLSFGLSETRLESVECFFGIFCFPFTRRDRSQVWEANWKRTTERGAVNFELTRSIEPNGLGFLAQNDQAALNLNHALGERLSAVWSLRATRNVNRGITSFAGDEYRYFSAETGLSRIFSPSWSLSLRLGRNDARRAVPGADATGWYSALALKWAPQARPIQPWLLH